MRRSAARKDIDDRGVASLPPQEVIPYQNQSDSDCTDAFHCSDRYPFSIVMDMSEMRNWQPERIGAVLTSLARAFAEAAPYQGDSLGEGGG